MNLRTVAALAVVIACLGGASSPGASGPSGIQLLDRYARGEFDPVVASLASVTNFEPIYKDLKENAPKWIEAGGVADRERRRLAAATFAMEAARIGALTDWKEVRMFIRIENIFWRPPSQLLEWGCALMRSTPEPTPIEHTWQMAALAVLGRAQDYEFLIGSPWEGRANKGDEFYHLEHTIKRFPKDRRLLLAQGIAAEWRLFPNERNTGLKEATNIFDNLATDPEVGGEASLRLGIVLLRSGRSSEAMPSLALALRTSRETRLKYLAQMFTGQVFETWKQADKAEEAYRAALEILPNAQSAAFPLAAILAEKGHRAEGAALIAAAVSANPRPVDPWREYGNGDERFWPTLISQLRKEIER